MRGAPRAVGAAVGRTGTVNARVPLACIQFMHESSTARAWREFRNVSPDFDTGRSIFTASQRKLWEKNFCLMQHAIPRIYAFQAEWEIERSKLLLDRIIDYRFLLKLDSNDDLRFNLCSTRCNVMYPNLLFVGHTLSKRKIIFTCSV